MLRHDAAQFCNVATVPYHGGEASDGCGHCDGTLSAEGKRGEDGAEALVQFLDEAKVVQEPNLDGLAERIERRLVDELAKTKAELTASIGESETRQCNFTLSVVGAAVGVLSLVNVIVQYLAK